MILGRLRAIGGYDVGHRVLDTAKHGLPQHRECVFIVGIHRRNSKLKGMAAFRWPRPVSCCLRACLLDPPRYARTFGRPSGPGRRQRLLQTFSEMEAAGLGRHSDDVVVVDMDGAKAHWMRDVSPCLTRNRVALGFYLPARGRRMTLAERFKLQGIPAG